MERQPNIIILDVGNTRTKLGWFQGRYLVERTAFANSDKDALWAWFRWKSVDSIALGSVARPDPELLAQLQLIAPTMLIAGSAPSPLRSRYTTPLTLGVDRLANAVAASALFSGRAALAVDIGTCITYDLVTADGVYQGGAISPGIRMRSQAMHAYSARLPFQEVAEATTPWGSSTAEAIQAGVFHGVWGELQHFLANAKYHASDAAVVLTGGDALLFARACKTGIFAHPFLTLEGLRILHQHGIGHGSAGPR
jgi:type III pantothenate kinase